MNWLQFLYQTIRRNFSAKALALVMAVVIYILVHDMIIKNRTLSFFVAIPPLGMENQQRIEFSEPKGLLCFFPADSEEMIKGNIQIPVVFEGPNNRIGDLVSAYDSAEEIVGRCRIPEDVLRGENERILQVGIEGSEANPY